MANDTTPTKGNDGRYQLSIDSAKTLAATDCGIVQNVKTSATITLPATVVGYYFIIRNAGSPASSALGAASGANGGVTINVSPNASDKIAGLNFTATDDKDAINTLGNVGDELQIVGDGVNGWMVTKSQGTWTREA
jgi:hypothetical protein